MKKSNSAVGQLTRTLEQARSNVSAAESLVQAAKNAKREAKQQRKLAKEEVRRAKKNLKQAIGKLEEANERLAAAEKKMARTIKHAPKTRKPAKRRSPARSSSSSHGTRRLHPSSTSKAEGERPSTTPPDAARPVAEELIPKAEESSASSGPSVESQ